MTPTSRASTVDEVAAKVSAAIMTGDYAIGTWLRQEALAERYGVSRQPIREALRQVQANGLVEVFPNRGALVKGPSPEDIRDAYLVRAELEGLGAELAARAGGPLLAARLDEAAAGFRDAAGLERSADGHPQASQSWSRANDLFHQAILEAAGVAVLRRTIEDLHRIVPRNLTRSAIRSVDLLEENLHQHERVHAALLAGDPVAARLALKEHIERSGELIATWFEQRQSERAPSAPRGR